MSFNITLYENSSPANKVTKDIDRVATISGVLREETSIMDPEFLIEYSDASDILGSVNYMYVQELGRYYFIKDIIAENNILWRLICHIDVLMTYDNQIRQQKAIVARQETKYNMMLDDGWYMAYQNPFVQLKTFSNATPFEQQEYVLVVAGS